MKVVAEIPGKDGKRLHSVRTDDYGNLFCTCPAADYGHECWAVKKVRADIEHKAMMWKWLNMVLPDFKEKQREQWEYVSRENRRLGIGVHNAGVH